MQSNNKHISTNRSENQIGKDQESNPDIYWLSNAKVNDRLLNVSLAFFMKQNFK